MKKKSLTWAILGCLVICAAFLLLQFSAGATNKSNSCPESMESCSKKGDGGSKMIWENLSHQFFSSF